MIAIPVYGVADAFGNRPLMGYRKPVGGERSKYMSHQGKQEIARRVRQEKAVIVKALLRYVNSLPVRPWEGA